MEVVIIGGIAAGMSIAAKAKRTNRKANITVIEKENYVSFGACGLPYYLGGQFDDGDRMMVRTPDEAVNIDFDLKEGKIKDLKTGEFKIKKYDKVAITTGAMPVMPNLEGIDKDNVYSITRLNAVDKLKSNLNDIKKQ